jgi:hypothetical protein
MAIAAGLLAVVIAGAAASSNREVALSSDVEDRCCEKTRTSPLARFDAEPEGDGMLGNDLAVCPADDKKKKRSKNPLAGCTLCHVDVEDEYVKSRHFKEKVACTECHGLSKGHVADENNEVKPDEMFARKDVDRLCSECHDCSREAPSPKQAPPPKKQLVCTDCHGAHGFTRKR